MDLMTRLVLSKKAGTLKDYTKDVFNDIDPIPKAMYSIRFYGKVYVV